MIDLGKMYQNFNGKETDETRQQQKKIAIGQLYRNALDLKSGPMLALLIKFHPEGISALYKGDSPLHYAAKYNLEAAVHILVDNGAELDLVNEQKETALQLAQRFNPKIFTYLQNEKKRRADEQEMVVARRTKFIENVMEKFFKQVAETKKETFVQIASQDSRKKFLEGLATVASYPKSSNLFHGELFAKLTVLETLLVETLVQKFEKRESGCISNDDFQGRSHVQPQRSYKNRVLSF